MSLKTTEKLTIWWLRRDLRLQDNAALYHALRSGRPVLPVFMFDTAILDALPSKRDARVEFIHQEISRLHQELAELGSSIHVLYGTVENCWKQLMETYAIEAVYTNHDYEGYARTRDEAVGELLASKVIDFQTFKDQVIFEKDEVLNASGLPYVVFTPYMRAWRQVYNDFYGKSYPTENYLDNFLKINPLPFISLAQMGFEPAGQPFPDRTITPELLKAYARTRNYPAKPGTSRMSLHLRFGTVSIRSLMRMAMEHSFKYANELIWRDFYMAILWHFPHISEGKAFRPAYDEISWRNNEEEFARWCEGRTGFPIVDAGMRELNATGYMHNRVRMITSSFLIKDLLIDWRWGEAYFAEKLQDFEFSSNNGGWQWAAGSGVDAAPYFRVFNPELQEKKFDPKQEYIRKWIPEFGTSAYPEPMVVHAEARARALETYNKALKRE